MIGHKQLQEDREKKMIVFAFSSFGTNDSRTEEDSFVWDLRYVMLKFGQRRAPNTDST